VEDGAGEALVSLLCASADPHAREAACQGLAHLTPVDPRVCGFLLDFGASAALILMLQSPEYVLSLSPSLPRVRSFSFFFSFLSFLAHAAP
jgi:hypothetical protein